MTIKPECKRGKLSKVLETLDTFYKSLFGLTLEICLNVKMCNCHVKLFHLLSFACFHSHDFRLFDILAA